MTRDAVVLTVLVLAFATLVTTHLALAAGLTRRHPRWRGPVALVVVPLAPWWGAHDRMLVRSVLWIAAAAVYVACLVLALR